MAKINPLKMALLLQDMPECLRQVRQEIRRELLNLRSSSRDVAIRAAWTIGCLVQQAIEDHGRYGEYALLDLVATTPGLTHRRAVICLRVARSFTASNIEWLLARERITLRHVELLARVPVQERRELFEQIGELGLPRLKDLRAKVKPWSRR